MTDLMIRGGRLRSRKTLKASPTAQHPSGMLTAKNRPPDGHDHRHHCGREALLTKPFKAAI